MAVGGNGELVRQIPECGGGGGGIWTGRKELVGVGECILWFWFLSGLVEFTESDACRTSSGAQGGSFLLSFLWLSVALAHTRLIKSRNDAHGSFRQHGARHEQGGLPYDRGDGEAEEPYLAEFCGVVLTSCCQSGCVCRAHCRIK